MDERTRLRETMKRAFTCARHLQSLFVKRTRFLQTDVKALQNFENQNDIIQMGHGNVKLLKITISNWRKFKNRRKPNGQLPTGQHIIIQGGDKPFLLCSVDDTSMPASKRSSSLQMWTHWHRTVVMTRFSCAVGARSLPCYLHMCLGEIVVLTIVCVLGTESLSTQAGSKSKSSSPHELKQIKHKANPAGDAHSKSKRLR